MRALGGAALCCTAIIVFLLGFVAIIDPAGTKMADDGDPFGKPASRWSAALISLVGIGIFIGGRWVTRTGNGTGVKADPADAANRR